MAEQQNMELIQKVYAAFAAGDVKTILDAVTEDTEWTNYGPKSIPYAGERRGVAQIQAFFQAIAGSTTGGKVTADTFLAKGDTVVALGRYSATVSSNGARIDTPVAHFFTVQNGKITKWVGFSDSAAVAAAHSGTAAGKSA